MPMSSDDVAVRPGGAGLSPAPSGWAARVRARFDRASFLVVFLGLPVALFAVFEVFPYLQAFWIALTDWNGFRSTMAFKGLDNFAKLWHDDVFLIALRNSLTLLLVVPTLVLGTAFLISWLLTAGGRGVGRTRGMAGADIHRAVAYFPTMIPVVIVGLIWAQMFDPRRGLLNGLLTALGFERFKNFAWLGEVATAMPVAVWVIVWGAVGFYVVLFIAAIKGIPAETYEAARLDGAGRVRLALSVTLPQMSGVLRTGYIFVGLGAMDSFGTMQALFAKASSPENSATTLTQYLWLSAFNKSQFAYATAQGVFLAAVTLVYAGLVFGVFRLINGPDEKGLSAA
jgi:N-acetylglucosamine transport system permease protein